MVMVTVTVTVTNYLFQQQILFNLATYYEGKRTINPNHLNTPFFAQPLKYVMHRMAF
jgi:hypothetical protein